MSNNKMQPTFECDLSEGGRGEAPLRRSPDPYQERRGERRRVRRFAEVAGSIRGKERGG